MMHRSDPAVLRLSSRVLPLPAGMPNCLARSVARGKGAALAFAALDIASGDIRARHYSRRRRIEFLDFMNLIVTEHTKRQIHVILDNLNSRRTRRKRPQRPATRYFRNYQ
jgi:hypothetical protein